MPAELLGVRWFVAPETTVAALAYIAVGIALGTVSGLVPGLHANTMAMLLAAGVSLFPGPPRLVGAAMLAAGVVHTFLDVVPALALGVPDPAMAVGALPGHKLVLGGRGREALRLSALGSGLAVALAIPLAVPITLGMQRAYPTLRAHLPVVLVGTIILLVLTEPTLRRKAGGAVASIAAGLLGVVALDVSPAAPLDVGGILVPLFAGLFGAPVLIEAVGGAGVPEQDDDTIAMSPWAVAGLGLLGTVSGAVVGYVPGVSAAVAATLALVAVPGGYGARGFIVATSGVNTANAVFALFALVALGSPRTGVLVALDSSGVPLDVPLLLVSISLAAAAGYVLVPLVGDRYLDLAGSVEYTHLSLGVLCLLVVLSALFAGAVGVVVFCVATAVGLVPARLGARRAHLMGVLLWPLAV